MGFIKYHDSIFGYVLRYLFRDFGIKKIVERIDYDVDESHLVMYQYWLQGENIMLPFFER